MIKKRDLTKGSVSRALLLVAIPTMLSQLLVFSYNIIDMKFVSGLGDFAVAAVGSAALFSIIGTVLNALAVIGTGIRTSHASGQNDNNAFHKAVNAGYVICFAIAILFIVFVMIFADKLFGLLNINDEKVIIEGIRYLKIFSFVSLFSCFNQLFMRVLNSLGLTDKSLLISALGLGLNVVLDPIFISVLGLGVAGAAYASLIANVIMTLMFVFIYRYELMYRIGLKIDMKEIKLIVNYGAPYMMQRFVFTGVSIVIGRFVAKYGTEAISAHRIGLQMESVTFMIIGGMLAAMAAFTGQNFGAKQYERIKYGYKVAVRIGFGYVCFTSLVFIFFSENIAHVFSNSDQTILYTSYYLKIIAFAQVFAMLEMIGNGLYTGIGLPSIPAKISVIFTPLRIPVAYILLGPFGLTGVFVAIAFTSVIKGGLSYVIYKFKVSREIGFKIVSE